MFLFHSLMAFHISQYSGGICNIQQHSDHVEKKIMPTQNVISRPATNLKTNFTSMIRTSYTYEIVEMSVLKGRGPWIENFVTLSKQLSHTLRVWKKTFLRWGKNEKAKTSNTSIIQKIRKEHWGIKLCNILNILTVFKNTNVVEMLTKYSKSKCFVY